MISVFCIIILVSLLIVMIRYRSTRSSSSNGRIARRRQFLIESREKMKFLRRYKHSPLSRTQENNDDISNTTNSTDGTISQPSDCIYNIANFDNHANNFNRPFECRQMQICNELIEDKPDENGDFLQSFMSGSSTSDSSHGDGSGQESRTLPFDEFKCKLTETFITNNINHTQGDAILNVLRSHPCFQLLPASSKTLLKTPRKPISTLTT